MERTARKPSKGKKKPATPQSAMYQVRRILRRGALLIAVFVVLVILGLRFIPIPTTPYIWSEAQRLDTVDFTWSPLNDTGPYSARSVVAAEDADFCLHWGFDMNAIRSAIDGGGTRGASTISQQVVKNVFLWQDRSWLRKALEAILTPIVEVAWGKRRILEIYLNVAEFDEGVFGIEAAAVHYFGRNARDLTSYQSAKLAAILPNPKARSANDPSSFVMKRANSIQDGAATILLDGRSKCFED